MKKCHLLFFIFQLLPQRCSWLYVMNNVLMSVSGMPSITNITLFNLQQRFDILYKCLSGPLSIGKSSQLTSHSLPALFEYRRNMQRRQGHLAINAHRLSTKINARLVQLDIQFSHPIYKCSNALLFFSITAPIGWFCLKITQTDNMQR